MNATLIRVIAEATTAPKDMAIAANGNRASKADIIAAPGINSDQWNSAIKELLVEGAASQTGERRGARYHLAGGNS